jgi:hypothetical protein
MSHHPDDQKQEASKKQRVMSVASKPNAVSKTWRKRPKQQGNGRAKGCLKR